jgi:hypothetical protein
VPLLDDALPFHYLALLAIRLFGRVEPINCIALTSLVGQVELTVQMVTQSVCGLELTDLSLMLDLLLKFGLEAT